MSIRDTQVMGVPIEFSILQQWEYLGLWRGPNGLNNYRPIANLPFLDKVLERIVAAQLKAHLERFGMLPVHQSAYRNHHSTETASVKVLNDLLLAIDKGNEAVLILLDYTAAFDTIDHTLLLHRLENDFFITGTVLDWIRSYLHNRSQRVIINDTPSATFPLICGVPQGSVIGPLLFVLYTSPLSKVINSHQGIQHAMYADDTQIYITLKPNGKDVATQKLSSCLKTLGSGLLTIDFAWMNGNLKWSTLLPNSETPIPSPIWLPEMVHWRVVNTFETLVF